MHLTVAGIAQTGTGFWSCRWLYRPLGRRTRSSTQGTVGVAPKIPWKKLVYLLFLRSTARRRHLSSRSLPGQVFFMQFGYFMFGTSGFSIIYSLGPFVTVVGLIGPPYEFGWTKPFTDLIKKLLNKCCKCCRCLIFDTRCRLS